MQRARAISKDESFVQDKQLSSAADGLKSSPKHSTFLIAIDSVRKRSARVFDFCLLEADGGI